jgi:hypothetical protein
MTPVKYLLATLVIGAGVCLGAAQAPTAQRFEEASIRPCDADAVPPATPGVRGGGPNSLQMTPGRLHAQCLTVATLIRTAYGLSPADIECLEEGLPDEFRLDRLYGLGVEDGRRVRGGSSWARSDRYTIDAVAADASTAATMSGPMLRTLLEQRFQLRAHVETEQVPAYSLVLAPRGLKIAPAASGSCEPRPRPTPGQSLARRAIDIDAIRRGAKPPCDIFGVANGPNYVWIGGTCRWRSSVVRWVCAWAACALPAGRDAPRISISCSSS